MKEEKQKEIHREIHKEIKINKEWGLALQDFFDTSNWQKLATFTRNEYLDKNKIIYPPAKDILKAFELTPFNEVKVVILGQDPYHGAGEAHGLCFSVREGMRVPPSLKNIYKEIESDLNIKKDFSNGNLESWAEQGVFLLNAILTVVADTPASHRGRGWEEFTDYIIKKLSEEKENLVFILWGNYARSKKSLIDDKRHLILESPHPSPFSAYNGFFGCKHFSKCNKFLKGKNKKEVEW